MTSSKLQLSTGGLKLNQPANFKINISPGLLSITKQKLSWARYPEEQTDFGPKYWSQGAKVAVVKELPDYWQSTYDWKAPEASNHSKSSRQVAWGLCLWVLKTSTRCRQT